MQDPTTRAVVCQLLAYANLHPSASDSVAGIQRWWLDPAGVDMQTLSDALDWLVVREAFADHVASDGRRRYRRNCSDAQLQHLLVELGRAPSAGDTAAGTNH